MKAFAVIVLAGAGVIALANGVGERWFDDVTQRAGIQHRHSNRVFKNPYAHIMAGYTALGAAVAVADFNGDGYDDLFVTDSAENGKNRLYRNNGNFTFTDVAEEAGLANGNDASNAVADVQWLDFNNDRRPDLLLIRFGQNLLYENLGNEKFRDVTQKSGLLGYKNAITSVAFDYDRDGRVDIFIGSYFQPVNVFNPNTPRFFPESFETAQNGGGLAVYHNNGNGTFTDVTEKAGFNVKGWTLDLGHADADNDGDEDLYVACDFGSDHFFVNNGNGTFTDTTEKAIGIDTKKGMNVDWGDYDGDGFLDVYVTNITDDYMREGNFLWKNNGNLTFSDVSRETDTYNTGWGWCSKFFDHDNDGWLDLYVVNGWVSAGKDSYVPDIFQMVTKPGIDFADARNWPPMGSKSLSGYQKKRLFHNEGGAVFKDQAARHGVDSVKDGRGIGLGDFDNDGRLDMYVANANAEPYFYRNGSPAGSHWVQFALESPKTNRFAIGAQVRVTAGGRTRLSFVNGGNGFAAQSTTRVHFGLGKTDKIDKVEIRWPSGVRQTIENIPPDHIYRIVEGKDKTETLVAKK
ncbi:MAG: CRTAC1 family protein [Bryobacteraceae bacterium]